MKKAQPKRQRTPKRGPGVAELEKILKEQQQGGQDNHPPSPPPINPSSWPHLLPLVPNLELLSGGPEKALFPITPLGENTKSVAVPTDHFFPNFQSSPSTFDFYNSLVNNNIGPGCASSSASATSSAATARLFHEIEIEHPSSQTSTHFNNLWTSPEEQQKILNAKRPRALAEERRGPMFTNMTMNFKESSSSSSSSLEINRTIPFNFDPNFRVTKRGFGGQLMSSTRSSGSESYKQADQEISNFMALGPSSSSSAPNEFAEFNFRLAQEIREGSQKRAGGASGSVGYNKITFNSSLYQSKSKGSKEAAIGSSYKGAAQAGVGTEAEAEAEGDGVDLDLKL